MADAMAAQRDAVDASTAISAATATAHARATGCPSLPSLWLPQGLSRGAPAATIYACRSSGATGSYQRAGLPPGGPAAPASQLELFGQCWRWTQPRTILKPRPESSTDRCRPARTASGRARERSVLCLCQGGAFIVWRCVPVRARSDVEHSVAFTTRSIYINAETVSAIGAAFAGSLEPLQLLWSSTAVENAAPHVVADRRDRAAPARRRGETERETNRPLRTSAARHLLPRRGRVRLPLRPGH